MLNYTIFFLSVRAHNLTYATNCTLNIFVSKSHIHIKEFFFSEQFPQPPHPPTYSLVTYPKLYTFQTHFQIIHTRVPNLPNFYFTFVSLYSITQRVRHVYICVYLTESVYGIVSHHSYAFPMRINIFLSHNSNPAHFTFTSQ